MTSVAALVGIVEVEAGPLTNGGVEGREEEALDGAVSCLGLEAPDGIVNCESEGWADEEEACVGLETGVGFKGDIHKDGGRDK